MTDIKFDKLYEILTDYNRKVNLTAITGREDFDSKHVFDCAHVLDLLPPEQGSSVVDVGSGAGFPGLVWAICRPDLKITLLEATGKKCDYLEYAAKELGVSVDVVNARAETIAHDKAFRGRFDIAAARAVASLPTLCELCLPFVKENGLFLALKGSKQEECGGALPKLGGVREAALAYNLPNNDSRTLITIRKIGQTPTKFPRSFAEMKRKPL